MKTGDSFSDDHGQTWTVDAALGRGVWARTWALRGAGGAIAVLKAPLRAEDLGDRPDAPTLAASALAVGRATRSHLLDHTADWLPPVVGTPVTGDAPPDASFLVPRYQGDLESRLQAGVDLADIVDHLTALAALLARPGAPLHGNLQPSNVLLDADGRPILVDPRPPGVDEAWTTLARAVPGRVNYLPPEAEAGRARGPAPGWDTWAICQLLHRATHAHATSDDPRRGYVVEPPRAGISRVALATLKDAAAARLRDESANLRFAARATDRLGAVLSRGLSPQTEPSPPYRFVAAADLHPRLVEVADLMHPAVTSVSKPTLEGSAREGVIEAGNAVELAVNVSTTSGVTAQEDIACGVQLRDLDAPDQARVRVPNARFTIKTYPSGRFRFHFTLPDVAPGRYQARVAFSVKGNDAGALVAECPLQVRPHVGYVPPPAPAPSAPAPLTFRRDASRPSPAEAPDRLDAPPDLEPAAPAEVIPFPRRGPPAPIRPAGEGEPEPAEAPGPADAPVVEPRPRGEPRAEFDREQRPDPVPLSAHLPLSAHAPAAHTAAGQASAGPVVGRSPTPIVARGPTPIVAGSPTAIVAGTHATPADPAPRIDVPRAPEPPTPTRVVVTAPPVAELPPLADPGLQDYPPPNHGLGADLPIYEAPTADQPPVWRAAWSALVRQTGDAFSAFMALVASALGLLILVAILARSC